MTPAAIAALPYRPCVGAALVNRDGLLFAGQRIDSTAEAWQMPQGGIDRGEDPRAAVIRELGEETGIAPRLAQVLAEHPDWIAYDLPPELVGRLWKGRYRGQSQKWFALRFLGEDADIDIATQDPEFHRWAWMPAAELMAKIVPFKREVYRRVFAEFAPLLA